MRSQHTFYVSLNSRNAGADCRHGIVEFLLAASRDEDIGTLFDEKFCSGQPNPSIPPVMTAVLPSSSLVMAFSVIPEPELPMLYANLSPSTAWPR